MFLIIIFLKSTKGHLTPVHVRFACESCRKLLLQIEVHAVEKSAKSFKMESRAHGGRLPDIGQQTSQDYHTRLFKPLD